MKRNLTVLLMLIAFSINALAEIEAVPSKVGIQILSSLVKAGEVKEWNEGFEKISEVDWKFVNLSGIHTRQAVYEDWFLFPYWNTASSISKDEPKDWKTGLAVKRGSNILYSWNLKQKGQIQSELSTPFARPSLTPR
jgi:hypothetical protein